MDILNNILNDPNINPAFRTHLAATMHTQEQAGYIAKREYIERCEAAGEKPDPIMADRVYWAAYNDAMPSRKMMA